MQLELSEEQRMIRASALAWLGGSYDFRQREASVHRDGGAPSAWAAFAEMGWLGLPLPESAGGLGAGLLETCLLLQAMGRFLVVEPYHAYVVQAARLLACVGTTAQQAAWLPGVVTGEHRIALAHAEAGDALPWSPRGTRALRNGDGWILDGAKRAVVSAPGCVRWIVSARLADEGSTGLFLVNPGAAGVSTDAYDTTDGGRAADLVLRGVAAEHDACLATTTEHALHAIVAEGLIGDCWYAVGAMQAAFQQTVDHVQQRRQFGQALASLQVVQHRIAEMAVQCAEAEAACELATLRAVRDGTAAADAACIARSKVVRAARYVAQNCVQLHGAMGVCEELPIAAAFRALTTFSQRGGDASALAAAYGQGLLASGAFAHSQVLHV
ncbi:MAG TPA: acyl-CoA dehydrogenase [Ramlibacter sp.]|nr:acyl-CoA dehydrogenase [Ramlibacter sp.]